MAESRPSATTTLTWYAMLIGGVLPFLLVGWTASSLTGSLAFAIWGVALAAGHGTLLRFGWRSGFRRTILTACLLLFAAAGCLVLARLVAGHRETLALGLLALLPEIHHPLLASPELSYAVAAVLVSIAGCLAIGYLISSRRASNIR